MTSQWMFFFSSSLFFSCCAEVLAVFVIFAVNSKNTLSCYAVASCCPNRTWVWPKVSLLRKAVSRDKSLNNKTFPNYQLVAPKCLCLCKIKDGRLFGREVGGQRLEVGGEGSGPEDRSMAVKSLSLLRGNYTQTCLLETLYTHTHTHTN